MDEESTLQIIDLELDAMLRDISAPPYFAAVVLRRAHEPKLPYWPDVLDSVGLVAFLAVVFALLVCFAPRLENPYWAVFLGAAIIVPAFCFGLGTLRERSD